MKFPDFKTYMQALWGDDFSPFPWQSRLAKEMTETGKCPDWVTLPTGTGKTSILEIAVYALASQLAHSPETRTLPTRIILAVNRRIVVDDAFARASQIQAKLAKALEAPDNPLHTVALTLKNFAGLGSQVPLEAYPLRGASFTDNSWARTPTQPLIITTTLDQLGSRLLFRGYGVSEGSFPIHAALLANDSLLILDEAHTEHVFSRTLQIISSLRIDPFHSPFQVTQLTATPPAGQAGFALDDRDSADLTISRRIGASKPTTLLPVVEKAKGTQRHKQLTFAISDLLNDLHGNEKELPKRILVVCNRVATAQELATTLSKRSEATKLPAAIEVLTGRIRPLDRDSLLNRLITKHELKENSPSADVPPLILISTQTIEVGADLDFDALITELAPLDNLRQRFGRLNRYGRDLETKGFIVAPQEALDDKKDDPIYGSALPKVWKWLQQHEHDLDFGSAHLDAILPQGSEINNLLAPPSVGPILLSEHLDLLAQTSPRPHIDPDVNYFIHGEQRTFAQVEVCLRSDLASVERDKITPLTDADQRLRDCPPLVTECATIPLGWFKEWLTTDKKNLVDAGSDAAGENENKVGRDGIIPGLIAWRMSPEGAEILRLPSDARPGDRIVLPTHLPIEKLQQLLPGLPEKHLDQYEHAFLTARDTLQIRLPKETLSKSQDQIPKELLADSDEPSATSTSLAEFATSLVEARFPDLDLPSFKKALWKVTSYGEDSYLLHYRRRIGHTPWPISPGDLGRQTNIAEVSSGLTEHQHEVETMAQGFAAAVALPPSISNAISFAARYHDIGKKDPRFQAMLYGTTPLGSLGRPALAKSHTFRSRNTQLKLRQLAELPEGFRHELLSCEILSQTPATKDHEESDLILHLVASHHGKCRAFPPASFDEKAPPFTLEVDDEVIAYPGHPSPQLHLSSGALARYSSLTSRFGWWGLAYLEAILRLADQRVSAGDSTQPSDS